MVIIGAGRVGTALHDASEKAGIAAALVRRDAGWEALDAPNDAPVVVAVRNDDLDAVLRRVPDHRRNDLVFVQNGAVRDTLRQQRLAHATRGLLYFAVPTRGAEIRPGGPSPFCGPRAPEMAAWLVRIGVPAIEVDWARFSAFELEKLIWVSAFGVLCADGDCDVGTVATTHKDELTALVAELNDVGRAAMGVDLPLPWLLKRVRDYALANPSFRASVNEIDWRNGWFVRQANRFGRPTAVHRRLLRQVGVLVADG